MSSTKATLILDPFAGSGTTGVAATNNNRDYILIDNSEKYCKLAKTRLEGGNWMNNDLQVVNDVIYNSPWRNAYWFAVCF